MHVEPLHFRDEVGRRRSHHLRTLRKANYLGDFQMATDPGGRGTSLLWRIGLRAR
jgi:hypothetical protein